MAATKPTRKRKPIAIPEPDAPEPRLCPICLNQVEQPTAIDCMHVFCYACLVEYVHSEMSPTS